MPFDDLAKSWETLAKKDPLWAIHVSKEKKDNKWDVSEFFSTGKKQASELFQTIRELGLKTNPKGKALDFGCGVGRLTQALCSRFKQVVGVDVSPTMIKLAKKHKKQKNCRYVLNEKKDLSVFPKNSFDFVYSWWVLQHMEEKYSKKYLEEFIRILKPGGLIVFQVPTKVTRQKKQYKLRSLINKTIDLLHLNNVFRWAFKDIGRGFLMRMNVFEKQKILKVLRQKNAELLAEKKHEINRYESTTFFVTKQKNPQDKRDP